jgi:hypothetical protein
MCREGKTMRRIIMTFWVIVSLIAVAGPMRHAWGAKGNFDGEWTGKSDAGQNCSVVNFKVTIKSNTISGRAISEYATARKTGGETRWEVTGSIDPSNKVTLTMETTDQTVRRPQAKWTGEITETGISLAQPSTDSCQRKVVLTRR